MKPALENSLTKSKRLVIMVSPAMKRALEQMGKEYCKTSSELVRDSVMECLWQYPIFREVYSRNLPTSQETEDNVI